MLFLALVIGLILAWLDVFFVASWAAPWQVSFLILGAMVCLALKRPRLALGLVLAGSAAADLMAPIGFWGERVIGYALLYALARWLEDSFFPVNRSGAALILTFLLTSAVKISAGFYSYFSYWWAGQETMGLLGGRYWLDSLLASLAAAIIMFVLMSGSARFNILTRRFFLIRR